MKISITTAIAAYVGAGVATIVLCWIYDRIVLQLQGYYDEDPVSGLGYLIQLVLWPIVLVTRTLAFPWQLKVALEAREARRED